ncbi:MAG: FKBP-type peptidyl-prolyl cis-trans isomerase, partial [Muribaculaceae bacterium]|nr:FKBP-type peptidyl-prolyl cis-trans isomerase [Muribaculaceae bacterium]
TEKSTFEMTYEGSLVDGTVFDRAESAIEVTGVGELIPGLREGVSLLRHGGEATFIIPGNLAYGVKGQQGKIPPMATLVYKIKIL